MKRKAVSNPPKLAAVVRAQLLQAGINLQHGQFVMDLGTDDTSRRRSAWSRKKRVQASPDRGQMIRKVVKTFRKATAPMKTGYLPRAAWGLEAPGIALSALLKTRAQVSGMVGPGEGGCATTAIRTTFPSAHQDPMMFERLRLFREWIAMLPGPPGIDA